MAHALKPAIVEYLEYLEIEKGRAAKTLENYGRYLNRFAQFVVAAGAQKVEDVTEDLIRQYRLFLNRTKDEHDNPLKRVTQNYHVIAVRNFLKYLAKRDIKSVSAERVELGKQEDREVVFLEKGELARLLDAPEGNALSALRDRAMLQTLFSTGMRVSELCSLDREKIDVNRGEVSIRGKGGKIRVVFLSDDARDGIKGYLAARSDVDEALFIRIPKNGAFNKATDLRLTPRSIQRIVKKHAIKAGIIGKKVSPHTMRHSYATDLLRNGADIRSVQAMLGHSSVTTTQIYTHVTDKGLREVHEKFHNKT
jgi:site-specific recombinase XerD